MPSFGALMVPPSEQNFSKNVTSYVTQKSAIQYLRVLSVLGAIFPVLAHAQPFDQAGTGTTGAPWAVKTHLLSPLVGEVSISAEYVLAKSYSLELGLGRLTRNHIASSTGVSVLGGGSGACDACDYNVNLSWFLRGRYFFSGQALDGAFLGALLHHKPFNGTRTLQGVTAPFEELSTDLGFLFGMQGTYAQHLLVEYHFGASMRMVSYDRPFFDFSGPDPVVFRETVSETGLGLFFGLMLGYRF